jgi:hypothetical protein
MTDAAKILSDHKLVVKAAEFMMYIGTLDQFSALRRKQFDIQSED